ncbi:TetR/AcrR family transcriptional regulator [Nocardioides sp. CN2-186]|uniref:TetR/AcrR family transcriptional regulator n=1 Tax=Nocardioides tweenelious TaxID=3156607 RepID=UPI0032B528EC
MVTRPSTEARLLDAADELLFTHGVATTPVDAILERAGASPATLYRAYGSKDGLVAAALERRQRSWMRVWEDYVERAPDERARLLAVFDALDHFRGRPDGARWCAFLGTAAEYADPPPVVAAAVQQDTDDLRTRLTELAAPVVGSRRAEGLAESLLLVVSGDLAMRLRTGGAGDSTLARSVADAVVDAALSHG